MEDLEDHTMIFDEEVPFANDFNGVFIVIDECLMSLSHEYVTTDASSEIINDSDFRWLNKNQIMEISDTDDIETNANNTRRI